MGESGERVKVGLVTEDQEARAVSLLLQEIGAGNRSPSCSPRHAARPRGTPKPARAPLSH